MRFKPRRSEEESIAHLMEQLPNCEIDDDRWGMKFDAPEGRVWIRRCRPNDEIFESDMFGTLNISEAWRNVAKSGMRPQFVNIDQALLNNVRGIDIEESVVTTMSRQRRGEPIFNGFRWRWTERHRWFASHREEASRS